MKINKLNYENYVIDYIEGTLSVELKKDFDLFLENNKDVYDEIKDYMSAPIYEESEEVFTNKKAILQNNNIRKYALLALIPMILLGAYFMINNKSEIKTETEAQVEDRSEMRDARSEIEEKRDVRSEKRDVEERSQKRNVEERSQKRDVRSEKKEVRREKQDLKTEPTLKKENFDLKNITKPSVSEMGFAAVETDKEMIKEELSSRPVLNTPIAIGNLEFGVDHNYQRTAKSNMVIAEVKKFNGSEDQRKNKNIGWLEMITPASFEDIDLRESLAIQSNKEIDSRKILNAFIPDTVVK